VPVPALVEVRSGEIAYDLSASDFSIKDEGVEQQVQLSDTDSQPRSLLLVVQTGRNASAQLGKMEHLDAFLDTILTGPADQVGILTFDSRPHVLQDFGVTSDAISHSLASIHIDNSYFLTFRPHDPAPGFHSLQVGVRRSKTTIVAARSGYWFSTEDDTNSEAKAQ